MPRDNINRTTVSTTFGILGTAFSAAVMFSVLDEGNIDPLFSSLFSNILSFPIGILASALTLYILRTCRHGEETPTMAPMPSPESINLTTASTGFGVLGTAGCAAVLFIALDGLGIDPLLSALLSNIVSIPVGIFASAMALCCLRPCNTPSMAPELRR